jgi:hypothetical protein
LLLLHVWHGSQAHLLVRRPYSRSQYKQAQLVLATLLHWVILVRMAMLSMGTLACLVLLASTWSPVLAYLALPASLRASLARRYVPVARLVPSRTILDSLHAYHVPLVRTIRRTMRLHASRAVRVHTSHPIHQALLHLPFALLVVLALIQTQLV